MPNNWGSNYYQPPAPTPQWGLAAQTNNFMATQAPLSLQRNLPFYQANMEQRGANVASGLRGVIPQDEITQLQQRAGERGIATGSPGSPNNNTAWLQVLGLTGRQIANESAQQHSQQIADTPQPELFNPMSLYQPQLAAHEELMAAQAGSRGASNPWKQNSTIYSNFMGLGGGEWMRR